RGIGHADAFAVRQLSADLDARENAVAVRLDDKESHLAVIQEKRMARFDGGKDFGVWQVHAVGIAGGGVGGEREVLGFGQCGWIGCEAAEPELWALQVEQNPDWSAVLTLYLPNGRRKLAHARMRGVAHVDAEDVSACLEEVRDHASV